MRCSSCPCPARSSSGRTVPLAFRLLLFSLLFFASASWAQTCQVDVLFTVENRLSGSEAAARPCYFLSAHHGTSVYLRVDRLAAQLGASFRVEERQVVLEREGLRAALAFSDSPQLAFQARSGALLVGGNPQESHLGLFIGGVYYVPLDPLVMAFGASMRFDGAVNALYVDLLGYQPPEASPSRSRIVAPSAALPRLPSLPRWGVHHDRGFSRVVLDLPTNASYSVSVGQGQLLVTLPELSGLPYYSAPEDPYLKRLMLYPQGSGMALRIEAGHAVSSLGQGFSLFRLPTSQESPHDRLVIDVGPRLRTEGLPASRMSDASPQELRELEEFLQSLGLPIYQREAAALMPLESARLQSRYGEGGSSFVALLADRPEAPVRAAMSGLVVEAVRISANSGYVVVIQHAMNRCTTYTNLQAPLVRPGAQVAQGELIGYLGGGGTIRPDVLHFYVQGGTNCSTFVDPLPFLGMR